MRIAFLCLFAILMFCCKKDDNNRFTNQISGTIINAPSNTEVFLIRRNGNAFDTISKTTIVDSTFSFKMNSENAQFWVLSFNKNSYNINLLLDSGQNVKIIADWNNLRQYKVFNSKNSQIIMTVENWTDSVNSLIVQAIKSNEPYTPICDNYRQQLYRFVAQNCSSPAAVVALSQKLADGQVVLHIENYYDLYYNVLKCLEKEYKSKEFFIIFRNFIRKYEKEKSQNALNKSVKEVYYFKARTLDGKTFDLNNLKNQNILLCFWASWQIDSYQTNLFLSDISKKFSKISIVQVALDNDKKIVEDSLTKYNFSHTIILEPMIWNSDIVKAYGVEYLPSFVLIEKTKNIFRTNSYEQILQKIQNLR